MAGDSRRDDVRYPASCDRELFGEDIPCCDGVGANGGFGFLLHQLVGEQEKFGTLVWEVLHTRNMQAQGWGVDFCLLQDPESKTMSIKLD